MKNLSLILRIVAIVAAVAATTLFFISKGKLADKEAQLTETKQVLATTQSDLSETNKTLEKTESQLKTERDNLANTKETLDETRSNLFAAEEDASNTKKLLSQESEKLAQLEITARDLRADLVATQQQLAAASSEAEINQLNEQVAELQKNNADLSFELEAKTAIIEAFSAKKTATKGAGGIASIDTSVASLLPGEPIKRLKLETTINSISTAEGLLVLDTTNELGLSVGQTITLVQNMQAVAKVQIQSIKENYAIANILPGSSGTNKLNSGSTVQILL